MDEILVSSISAASRSALHFFFRTALNTKVKQLGTQTTIQTNEDYGRWHPHLRQLLAEVLFMPDGRSYGKI